MMFAVNGRFWKLFMLMDLFITLSFLGFWSFISKFKFTLELFEIVHALRLIFKPLRRQNNTFYNPNIFKVHFLVQCSILNYTKWSYLTLLRLLIVKLSYAMLTINLVFFFDALMQ